MQAKRVRCVLPREFILMYSHGVQTALPRPAVILSGLDSPRLVNAA